MSIEINVDEYGFAKKPEPEKVSRDYAAEYCKQIDDKIDAEITNRQNADTTLQTNINGKADAVHNHDERYYTESEVNTLLGGKANSSHQHNISDVTNLQTQLNAKYVKAVSGIPKSDLASDVQTSLGKADTAIQSHQDISGKVDKEQGKGLSTNDYNNYDKSKVYYLPENIQEIIEDIDDSKLQIYQGTENEIDTYFGWQSDETYRVYNITPTDTEHNDNYFLIVLTNENKSNWNQVKITRNGISRRGQVYTIGSVAWTDWVQNKFEENYKLIEKIIVGYSKLTSQQAPADWDTIDWTTQTKYFTRNGLPTEESMTYEVIHQATAPEYQANTYYSYNENDTIEYLSRSRKTDGTYYNFKQMRVIVKSPSSAAKWNILTFNGNVNSYISYSWCNDSSGAGMAYEIIKKPNGYFQYRDSRLDRMFADGYKGPHRMIKTQDTIISGIGVQGGNANKSGIIIEIWGIGNDS